LKAAAIKGGLESGLYQHEEPRIELQKKEIFIEALKTPPRPTSGKDGERFTPRPSENNKLRHVESGGV